MIGSKQWIAALGLITSAGCVAELGDEDIANGDEVTATTSALTILGGATIADTKYGTANLGTATNKACFLTGVGGWLTTGYFPTGDPVGGAGVVLDARANAWRLYIQPSVNGWLKASATCVTSTSLTPEVTWRSDKPKALIAPVAPGRRCFFTQLKSGRDNVLPRGGFSSTLDLVHITSDGSNWYIDGDQSGLVWASARCITVTEDITTALNWANPGTDNTVAATPASPGVACFMTQVSGKLNNSSDPDAGPQVKYNAMYNYLDYYAKDGNGGRVKCVR